MLQSPPRYVALDSWRGICACLVVFHHVGIQFPRSHIAQSTLVGQSWLFVDFFFVLSGFVIAANYERRLLDGYGIGKFMLLRFGRLYPLHLTMLLVFIAYELTQVAIPELGDAGRAPPFTTEVHAIDTVIANLLLLQSLHVFDFHTWNIPAWSISTEFYTYLIFAAALVIFRDRLDRVLILVLAASPFVFVALGLHDLNTTYEWGLPRCVFGFAAGVAAHHFWLRKQAGVKTLLREPATATAIELLVVTGVVVFVLLSGFDYVSMLAPYVFAVAVLVFAAEAGAVSRLFLQPPFVLLGLISYSVYMVHYFIVGRVDAAARTAVLYFDANFPEVMRRITTHDIPDQWDLLQGDLFDLALLAFIIAVSYVSYRLIEDPGRYWVRKLLSRRRVTA